MSPDLAALTNVQRHHSVDRAKPASFIRELGGSHDSHRHFVFKVYLKVCKHEMPALSMYFTEALHFGELPPSSPKSYFVPTIPSILAPYRYVDRRGHRANAPKILPSCPTNLFDNFLISFATNMYPRNVIIGVLTKKNLFLPHTVTRSTAYYCDG